MNASETHGVVFKSHTATLLARVVGWDGTAIAQANLSAAEYSIYLLDDNDPDYRLAIEDHDEVSLTVSAVIFNALQTDSRWTKDATGYNFRHTIEIDENQAFTLAGRKYLVQYTLTPTTGQPIVLRFRLHCI